MILTLDQIKQIVTNNPYAARMAALRKQNAELRMHMYGEGMEKYLERIDGFEKDALRDVRVKYARSNADLFSRLARPIDKVFSAKGGSTYYNLTGERDKKAAAIAMNITGGMSVKKWLEHYWRPHFLDDPNGMIFMEVLPQPAASTALSPAYPTYKSVQDIYAYEADGSRVLWVMFNTTKQERTENGLSEDDTVYRLVDDSQDVYVRVGNGSISLHNPLPNLFMQVPAILNSDIISPSKPGVMDSLFTPIIHLAKEFLTKGSIKITHEFLHGFPKYWQYQTDCAVCSGSRYVGGKECETCKGTGKKLDIKVSDSLQLAIPGKDDQVLTPNVAGYVSPDKIYHEIATAELRDLEIVQAMTLWGTGSMAKQDQAVKTATEIVADLKPEADRLASISDMAERRHKFIVDMALMLAIDQNYKGSTIIYGKRFLIEGPDELWAKYQEAKKNGASHVALTDMLVEYYEAKYHSDPVSLFIQTKLIDVEPFVHHTLAEAKALGLPESEWMKKLYFGKWYAQVTEAELISKTAQELSQSLEQFAAAQQQAQPDPAPIPQPIPAA